MIRLLGLGLATGLLAIALLGGLIGWNLWTYHRLTAEARVAELQFTRLGERRYSVLLTLPDASPRRIELQGDEWQLDVRLITWQPWMQLLGNDPLYRLDRLTGRYRDIERARNTTPTIHPLSDDPGLDLWRLVREGGDWVPGVDAAYGSAVFLPMAHNADYRVTLSAKGLVARPLNEPARIAISSWN